MLNGPFAKTLINTLQVNTTCLVARTVFITTVFVLLSVPSVFLSAQNQGGQNQGGQQRYQQPAGQANQATQQNQQGQPLQKITPQQLAAQQQAAQTAQPTREELQKRAAEYAAWQAQQAAKQSPPKALNMPKGFPLAKEDAVYIGQLLDHWETNSKKVELYKCQFLRYSYDLDLVGYRDPQTKRLAAHSMTYGEIRFAAPDRARYETTKTLTFSKPPAKPGAEAEYKEAKDKEALLGMERWMTDGKRIFEFDFPAKILYDDEIPKRLQGNVAESPLPFLFGVNKKELLSRYWVTYVATPQNITNEYWLELYPKRIEDARNYKKIEVTIAREDFLPKAMHLYLPQYDPAKGNESSHYFLFAERQVNSQLAKLADKFSVFVSPRLPRGWKRVNRATKNSTQAAVPPNAQQQNGSRR